jgi:hypothetical protein
LSDSEFIVSPDISPESPITEGFYSNMDKVMKLQRNVFETFWNYSIPGELKMMHLEVGDVSIPRPPPTIVDKR